MPISGKKPGILKLILSLAVDGIGMGSYILPGIGEIPDVAWAFISATLVLMMYGELGFAVLNWGEEMSPGTFDWLPSASICWFYLRLKK